MEVSTVKSLLLTLFILAGCTGDTGFTGGNDPGENQEGNGRITLSDKALEFDGLQVEYASTKYLRIESAGDNDLVIYRVRILDSGGNVFFTEGVEDLTLAPKESNELPVVATLHEALAAKGSLRVESNDPDALTIEVPLLANPAPVDTGFAADTAPAGS
jgi:hypothetical protein